MRTSTLLRLLAASVTLLMGCSPGSDPAGGKGGGGNESTGSFSGGSGGDGGSPCEGTTYEAEFKPLNLYILVDASNSMAGTKWEAAREGLEAFLGSASANDVNAAINFFPRPPGGLPACDQMAYKEPAVAFGPLPENSQSILDAFDARSPDGFNSPMFPALGGAILKGIDLSIQNPEEVSAVLLVTDGKPEGPGGPGETCAGKDPSDPASVAELASTGFGYSPSVRTLVIGLPGVDVAVAHQIAAAGGSEEAVIVGTSDTANQFASALEKAHGAVVGCEFQLPDDLAEGTVEKGFVNVTLTPGGDPAEAVIANPGCSGAADEGWTFDDAEDPTAIVLCDATCARLEGDAEASINIVLGCPTAF